MMKYKGIILAGGMGTRLYPATCVLSKQLLPVYDKPMIYYSLSILMLGEIYDILIITTPSDISRFQQLLGDGSRWGINLEYKIQERPDGLAQAFLLAEEFLAGHPACLILGDNIYYGNGITAMLKQAQTGVGATIFAYQVSDPKRYGIVGFDDNCQVISLEEKPQQPRSDFAITGLYFYDKEVVKHAKTVKPSKRGELEITDLNSIYLQQKQLQVIKMQRGFAWLDTGTPDALIEAANFIQTIEHRQGIKVACLEEIALHKNLITVQDVKLQLSAMGKSSYAEYLNKIVISAKGS